MKILVTGDLVINQNYELARIDPEVIDLFTDAEINIVNLEAPITTSGSKIQKTGPHLKSEQKSTSEVLNALKIDVISLANNHVLDYDEQGVTDTLDFCNRNNFHVVGAGMNLQEASETLCLATSEGKIAIINFAENEWASATETTAGANPMDIIDNARQIKEAKEKADYVFVIIHGGHEYYNLPSPRMQKQYRFYAEQGADLVVGHHTHCISGNEVYNRVPIYYSLGNFLFTKPSPHEDWYLGLVLEISIKKGLLKTQLHPVKQQKQTHALCLLVETEKEAVLNRIREYNLIISNPMRLKHEWDSFVQSLYKPYLQYWSPLSSISNRYIKAALRKLGITMLNNNDIALKLNLFRCEAHRDISKEITEIYLGK